MKGSLIVLGLLVTLLCNVTSGLAQVDSVRMREAPTGAAGTIDEDLDLNIPEHHIDLGTLSAGLELRLGDERSNLEVRAGVGVIAYDVDLWLRGVRGQVRFRATLEPIRRVIQAHRKTTSPTR